MNAFYVTVVSIPLLLVLLAGFNHAHGLTTFGKTQSNSNNNQPPTPTRPCTVHANCSGFVGASCVPDPRDNRKACLCGNNEGPVNGACSVSYRGPKHLCKDNAQCVEKAKCMPTNKNGQGDEKICKCMEGYIDVNNMCSGGLPVNTLNIAVVLLFVLGSVAATAF